MENEDFQVTINVTQENRARTMGEGYPPRGVYQVQTTRIYQKSSEKGTPGLYFEHQVLAAYVPSEDGTLVLDPSQKGRQIRNTVSLPDGGEYDNLRVNDLLGAMIGHNAMTKGQANSHQGPLNLTKSAFLGKTGQLLYDPPKAGTRGYPEVRYLDSATAEKYATNKVKISSWPQDNKATRSNAAAAAGTVTPKAGFNEGAGAGAPPAGGFGGLPTANDTVAAFGGGGGAAASGWGN